MSTSKDVTKADAIEFLQKTTAAFVAALRERPEGIPSGHFYAVCQQLGMPLRIYNQVIESMLLLNLVRKSGDVLHLVPETLEGY